MFLKKNKGISRFTDEEDKVKSIENKSKNKNIKYRISKIIAMTSIVLTLAATANLMGADSGFSVFGAEKPATKLNIYVLDVGQGDSIYIDYGDFDLLIDGGPNDKGDYLVNFLQKQGLKDLDLMVATHPHADHIGGLDDVLRKFEVKQIIDSGAKLASASSANTNYQKALKAEVSTGAKYEADQNRIIKSGALTVEIVEAGDGFEELNDESVIVKVTLGKFSALFTGDAESLVEKKLLKTYEKSKWLDVDFFKAAHHGSRTSNSAGFLKAMSPSVVVISSGLDNDYGHPHQEALDSYKGVKAQVYNTAVNGVVTLTTDGSEQNLTAKKGVALDLSKIGAGGAGAASSGSGSTAQASAADKMTSSGLGLYIESVDLSGEMITIANGGKVDVNLKGYWILSTVGNQKYVFPSYVLKAGAKVTVYSKGGKGQLKWSDQNIWNNSGDPAVLCSPEGERLSEK